MRSLEESLVLRRRPHSLIRSPGPLSYALAAIVLWGTLAAVVGHTLDSLAVPALLFWSFLFAALTLSLAHLLRGGDPAALLIAPPRFVALGLFGIFGYHACFFEALARAPIVQANLLNYLWPLLIVVLAPLIVRERLTLRSVAGALAGFAGAVLVVTQGRSLAVDAKDAGGYLLAAMAAFSWSVYSLLLRRTSDGVDRIPLFTVWAFLASAIWAGAAGEIHAIDARTLGAVAWLGVGPMAAAFVCWDRAMRSGNAASIGALSYLDPLLSTLCVSFALGKAITGASWIGMALIVGGAAIPVLTTQRGNQSTPVP